jgi:hypothetical protein
MKRLLKRLGDWLDARLIAAERRKCQKGGHKWIQSGGLWPEPSIWFECTRMGCKARTEALSAKVTWQGPNRCTMSPKERRTSLRVIDA